jgi:hypothetical protein
MKQKLRALDLVGSSLGSLGEDLVATSFTEPSRNLAAHFDTSTMSIQEI